VRHTHDSPPRTIEECNYLLIYLLTYLLTALSRPPIAGFKGTAERDKEREGKGRGAEGREKKWRGGEKERMERKEGVDSTLQIFLQAPMPAALKRGWICR